MTGREKASVCMGEENGNQKSGSDVLGTLGPDGADGEMMKRRKVNVIFEMNSGVRGWGVLAAANLKKMSA